MIRQSRNYSMPDTAHRPSVERRERGATCRDKRTVNTAWLRGIVASRGPQRRDTKHLGTCLTWYVFHQDVPAEKLFRIERFDLGSNRYILTRLDGKTETGERRVVAIEGDFSSLKAALTQARRVLKGIEQ